MKKVFNKNFIYTHYNSELTLDQILEKVKKNGITKKNYHKVKIKIDYSGCYYESDSPNLEIRKDN